MLFRKKRKLKKRCFTGNKSNLVIKNKRKYKEFVLGGGLLSGLFDISDEDTLDFVLKYKEYISPDEIGYRNEKGLLVRYFNNS